MQEHSGQRRARPWRLSSLAMLLPLALSSTAQTPTLPAPLPAVGGTTGQVSSAAAQRWRAAPAPYQSPTKPLPYRTALNPAQVRPVAPGFDVAAFEALANDLTVGQRVPGLAMAIVQDGRVISARGYGVTDVRNPQPINAHTVFRLASLSKAFAGTITGLLVNDGVLRWDSKVADYVPSFQLIDPVATGQVTVADVLSHRTGLRWHNAFDRDIEANADYYSVSQKLATAPLGCKPGQCYEYQNVAFSLVGDVVFAATGSFYDQAVDRRIFKPLGMNDASIGLAGIEHSPSWARPHVRARSGWASLQPKPTYYRLAPAAGVNASASDMAQWLLAHLGHRPDVLPAPLLATLHAPLISTPGEMRAGWRGARVDSASYALAWRVLDYSGQQVVFHAGAVEGYRGLVAMVPGRDFGVAILWNSTSPLPSGLLPTVLDTALGLPPQQWLHTELGKQLLLAQTNGHPLPQTLQMAGNDDAAADDEPGASSGEAVAAPH
ncbi:serine hydrolase domain-containing protein [Pseudoxanthomonas spadix]|nr:serine hydrolase domain-containing protein [Pseudoxanthomonas spadix]